MSRRLRWRLRRWWDRRRAPWPIVNECRGHLVSLNATFEEIFSGRYKCPQCAGKHEHDWRSWPKAPVWVTAGSGVPVRCRICGARKCDLDGCQERRHNGHRHAEFEEQR